MSLPVGVTTRTLNIGRPFNALGVIGVLRISVTPVFGGTAQRLVWSATGDTFEAFTVAPPTQTDPDGDPTESIDLPIVDQAGWLDGSGNAITGWSYQVTVTPSFPANGQTNRQKPYTKNVSPLSTHSSPIDLDKWPDGSAAAPTLTAGPFVASVAGVPGAVVSVADLSAALGNQLMRFVYYGTDPTVARLAGTAPVFWIGDPAVEPANQVAGTDFRIPIA